MVLRQAIFSCIFRASQENSISRPNALYFKDHRDRSGLSGNICENGSNIYIKSKYYLFQWKLQVYLWFLEHSYYLRVVHWTKYTEHRFQFQTNKQKQHFLLRLADNNSWLWKPFWSVLNFFYVAKKNMRTCYISNMPWIWFHKVKGAP